MRTHTRVPSSSVREEITVVRIYIYIHGIIRDARLVGSFLRYSWWSAIFIGTRYMGVLWWWWESSGFFFGKRRGERVQLGVSHIGSRQYRKWEWEVAASMGWKKLAESLFWFGGYTYNVHLNVFIRYSKYYNPHFIIRSHLLSLTRCTPLNKLI